MDRTVFPPFRRGDCQQGDAFQTEKFLVCQSGGILRPYQEAGGCLMYIRDEQHLTNDILFLQ
jgi:hypothetical protein